MYRLSRVCSFGVLISGRGSNLAALYNHIQAGSLKAEIKVVISNKAEAKGLEFARVNGLAVEVVERPNFETKEAYESEITSILHKHKVELVVLAGYMRILGKEFISEFENRILNIHPSLLPAFKGLDAQKQALDYGVKVAGCTVHFVDNTLDGGTLIMQDVVAVSDTDSEDSLTARILEKEHFLYAKALQLVINTKLD